MLPYKYYQHGLSGCAKLMLQPSPHKLLFTHRLHRSRFSHERPSTLACLAGEGANDLYLSIGGGDKIKLPKKRSGIHPNAELTRDEVVELQLQVGNSLECSCVQMW